MNRFLRITNKTFLGFVGKRISSGRYQGYDRVNKAPGKNQVLSVHVLRVNQKTLYKTLYTHLKLFLL